MKIMRGTRVRARLNFISSGGWEGIETPRHGFQGWEGAGSRAPRFRNLRSFPDLLILRGFRSRGASFCFSNPACSSPSRYCYLSGHFSIHLCSISPRFIKQTNVSICTFSICNGNLLIRRFVRISRQMRTMQRNRVLRPRRLWQLRVIKKKKKRRKRNWFTETVITTLGRSDSSETARNERKGWVKHKGIKHKQTVK